MKKHQPLQGFEDMKQRLNEFIATLSEEDIRRAVQHFEKRVRACLAVKGEVFEYLMKKNGELAVEIDDEDEEMGGNGDATETIGGQENLETEIRNERIVGGAENREIYGLRRITERENFENNAENEVFETSDFEGDENLEIETIAERNEAGIETEDENLDSEAESEDINFLVGNNKAEYDEMMKNFEKGPENENTMENLENEAENDEEEFRKLGSRKIFRPPFRR